MTIATFESIKDRGQGKKQFTIPLSAMIKTFSKKVRNQPEGADFSDEDLKFRIPGVLYQNKNNVSGRATPAIWACGAAQQNTGSCVLPSTTDAGIVLHPMLVNYIRSGLRTNPQMSQMLAHVFTGSKIAFGFRDCDESAVMVGSVLKIEPVEGDDRRCYIVCDMIHLQVRSWDHEDNYDFQPPAARVNLAWLLDRANYQMSLPNNMHAYTMNHLVPAVQSAREITNESALLEVIEAAENNSMEVPIDLIEAHLGYQIDDAMYPAPTKDDAHPIIKNRTGVSVARRTLYDERLDRIIFQFVVLDKNGDDVSSFGIKYQTYMTKELFESTSYGHSLVNIKAFLSHPGLVDPDALSWESYTGKIKKTATIEQNPSWNLFFYRGYTPTFGTN